MSARMSLSENTAAKRIVGFAWAQAGKALEAAIAAPALSAARRVMVMECPPIRGSCLWDQNLYTAPIAPMRIVWPLTSAGAVKFLVSPAEPDGRKPAFGSLEIELPRP